METTQIPALPTVEMVEVTPQMAQGWLETALYDRQRSQRAWHAAELAIEMERGRFTAGTQIHFAVLDGKEELLNGQHTLGAIVRSGKAQQLSILRTPVASEEEVGELYGRHDRHLVRTRKDVFAARGMSESTGLPQTELSAFAAGVRIVAAGFAPLNVYGNPELSRSLDRLSEVCLDWAEAGRLYFTALDGAQARLSRMMRRAAVVAVGLATFNEPELRDKAQAFWRGTAQDDGLRQGDPRKTLIKFLDANDTAGLRDAYSGFVASAWNAFFEGRNISALRQTDADRIGLTILGTRFKASDQRPRTAA